MKNKALALACLGLLTSYSSAFARGGDRAGFDRKPAKYEPEIVKWVGEIKDEASDHTTEHQHALEFVKKDDGKVYDIVESPELVKLHHETEKNYLVEIEAEKKPRFLFWGGNLIVKNFTVLEETASVPHLAPIKRTSSVREIGGRRP
jgi:hypothetical protein